MNDLPREQLQWHCPNQIVFASLYDHSNFVLSTFYNRPVRESDLVDANYYPVSENFAHRAMCFQQFVLNAFADIKARALESSIQRDPCPHTDLQPGQAVLIDWDNCSPPCAALLPLKRGPYRVLEVRRNCATLQHFSSLPPEHQPATLFWSKHAHVYDYFQLEPAVRHPADPSAAFAPSGPPGRNIDCVLSHAAIPRSHAACNASLPSSHVANHEFSCRLYGPPPPGPAGNAVGAMVRTFRYDVIKHTLALDIYVNAIRSLTGHMPVSQMPLNWSPHAVIRSQRPSHPPVPIHEAGFPAIQHSDQSDISWAEDADSL
jgi:hypothetical protein